MEVLKNGCNLNDYKGLIAVILAPWTVLQTKFIWESYWGLKSSSDLQNKTFWLIDFVNFYKKNYIRKVILLMLYGPISGCHVAFPEATTWPQAIGWKVNLKFCGGHEGRTHNLTLRAGSTRPAQQR